jgi:3-hydroxyacyl-CoA dehydrogenase / enoyl-CoA hydratase / 3-hydroxybutyryl-CoA epimerase
MIKYHKDTHNIVTLTLDMSGRPDNVINHEIGNAFMPVVSHLKAEKAKGLLKGVIITSAKGTFLSGGDLDYLYQRSDAAGIFSFSEQLKFVLREIERPGVPVVAAINGSALGIGFELALACHYRIVLDKPSIVLGLPESGMGLIPGSGGTVRLMWQLGIRQAYQVLTSDVGYTPREALKAGLVDALAPGQKAMLEMAKAWLLEQGEARRFWDRPGSSIPGGDATHPENIEFLRERSVAVAAEKADYFSAAQAIILMLYEGSKVDFDTACRIESRYYARLLVSQPTQNMIKAFWLDRKAIERGDTRPKGFGKFRPRRIGIIGAGRMGSGIALSCLLNGMSVVIKDVSKLIAANALVYVQGKLADLEEKGRIDAQESKALLNRIQITDHVRDFEHCDIVVEAVFENYALKHKVTREAEAFLDEYSLFGSNSISIPISTLAEACQRPENYVGLHFFPPVEEVPLVEIVKGRQSSDESVARAFDFVRSMQKIPIIVKDVWGFYAARVQNTFILEGITMLQEGLSPAMVENLGRQSGMPRAALELADELGLEIVLRYEQLAAAHYGVRYIQHPAVHTLNKMLTEWNRPGKSAKAGFYTYQGDEGKTLWQHAYAGEIRMDLAVEPQEIFERLLFVQVIEAFWCLQEGVIRTAAEANLGSIYGWGFPACKGGVIQFVQDYGIQNFLSRCAHFEALHGPRFKPPRMLTKLEG